MLLTRRHTPLLLLALLAVGCNDEKQYGTVSGTVIYKSKPVNSGDVNFISKDGGAAIARIDDAGQFTLDGPLPVGEYKVYVSAPVPEPQPPGKVVAPPKKFVLPTKFQDPATSGLTATVKEGMNSPTIELKD